MPSVHCASEMQATPPSAPRAASPAEYGWELGPGPRCEEQHEEARCWIGAPAMSVAAAPASLVVDAQDVVGLAPAEPRPPAPPLGPAPPLPAAEVPAPLLARPPQPAAETTASIEITNVLWIVIVSGQRNAKSEPIAETAESGSRVGQVVPRTFAKRAQDVVAYLQ